MSTIKATHIQHPSAASPNLTLASDGTVSGGAGLGGLVHIHTETFASVSSVSIDDVFSEEYDNYRIIIYGATASTDNALDFRLRASGTDSTSSDYHLQILNYANTSLSGGRQTGGVSAEFGRINTGGSSFGIDMCSPFLPKVTTFISNNSYNLDSTVRQVYGRHGATTSFDGLTIYHSGTITGTIRIYGYANS
jgi:hypothetical protein